ncbi:MAG: calcium-binding protein [Acidimicrobiales bacterium]
MATSIRMLVVLGLAVAGLGVVEPPPSASAQVSCFGSVPTIYAVPGQPTTGTPGPDVIWGTPGADVIRGGGGNDRICSGDGFDRVFGDLGNDRIDLGPGRDVGRGGPGSDHIRGGRGRDVISGGSGNDQLGGGHSGDDLTGGLGNDSLNGKSGDDAIRGGPGDDVVVGGGGNDGCKGGGGVDRFSGCTDTRPTAHFSTLSPGSPLPSGAQCAVRVRSAKEIRPGNRSFNRTMGTDNANDYRRVSGFFTGTTDEIIQWAACKWGIDENLVRSQMVEESWWRQTQAGDFTSNQSRCHVALRTSSGRCPESIGIGQIKYRFHRPAFERSNAIKSTAYNIDYTYAYWRDCFEGGMGWLNNVARGRVYRAGNALGCMGVWFHGEWYTPPAVGYMNDVRGHLNSRFWETEQFRTAR